MRKCIGYISVLLTFAAIGCGGSSGGTAGGQVNGKDVNLSALTLTSGTIVFDQTKTSYNVEVESTVTTLTVNATASDATASIRILSTTDDVTNTAQSQSSVTLVPGKNIITINLTATDQTAKTYTVVVTRLTATGHNADLAGLTVSSIGNSSWTLSPSFSANHT